MGNFQIAENFAGRLPLGDFFGVPGPFLRPKKAKKCAEIEQLAGRAAAGFVSGGPDSWAKK
jgi:hypothetical protein